MAGWRRQTGVVGMSSSSRRYARRRKPPPVSRRAMRADVALAVVLTVVALYVTVRYPGDGPVHINPEADVGAGVPPPPSLPDPGRAPVEEEPSSVPWALVVLSDCRWLPGAGTRWFSSRWC